MVIVPSLGLSGALIKGGIAEMMRLSIDPEIKIYPQEISRSVDRDY